MGPWTGGVGSSCQMDALLVLAGDTALDTRVGRWAVNMWGLSSFQCKDDKYQWLPITTDDIVSPPIGTGCALYHLWLDPSSTSTVSRYTLFFNPHATMRYIERRE